MSSDKKVDIVGPEGNKNVRTFIFKDEDHTLGNSLRYILMREYVNNLLFFETFPIHRTYRIRLVSTYVPDLTLLSLPFVLRSAQSRRRFLRIYRSASDGTLYES